MKHPTKTGIDLYGEAAGTQPNQEYYEKRNVEWSDGMILNLAIGQGECSATMLQLAKYTGIVATEGLVTVPHLNLDTPPQATYVEGISRESFDVVRRGMHGVINDPSGTAKSARIKGHVLAGKTGTAQNPHGADHKIFVTFAPTCTVMLNACSKRWKSKRSMSTATDAVKLRSGFEDVIR